MAVKHSIIFCTTPETEAKVYVSTSRIIPREEDMFNRIKCASASIHQRIRKGTMHQTLCESGIKKISWQNTANKHSGAVPLSTGESRPGAGLHTRALCMIFEMPAHPLLRKISRYFLEVFPL